MFIKKSPYIKLCLLAYILPSCIQVHAIESQEKLANGLSSYIRGAQEELGDAGPALVKEQQEHSIAFIDDYNAYRAYINEKTSRPIGLSSDNDCLANLRLIDLDIIPVDPMDILKPLKIKIKDLLEQSPCEMITGTINDELDKIDYSTDSPFGTVASQAQSDAKRESDAIKKEQKIARKEEVKGLVSDMGSDFKSNVNERRSVVFEDDGSVVQTSDYEVKSTTSNPKTEGLVNKEGLLNVWEVFGKYTTSNETSEPLGDQDNKILPDSQNARAREREAADIKAREEALKKTGNGT